MDSKEFALLDVLPIIHASFLVSQLFYNVMHSQVPSGILLLDLHSEAKATRSILAETQLTDAEVLHASCKQSAKQVFLGCLYEHDWGPAT